MGRAGLVLLASVLTGVVAAVIVQSWLEVVEGDWVANAAVLGLTVLAIGAALAGLYAVIGKAGLLIGALTDDLCRKSVLRGRLGSGAAA